MATPSACNTKAALRYGIISTVTPYRSSAAATLHQKFFFRRPDQRRTKLVYAKAPEATGRCFCRQGQRLLFTGQGQVDTLRQR